MSGLLPMFGRGCAPTLTLMFDEPQQPRVLIVGGGITGMEALLALRDLAGKRVRISLISANPELTYLPERVEEPFTAEPARRRDLALACEELGVDFRLGEVSAVNTASQVVSLRDGSTERYDELIACLGGRRVPAYREIPSLLDLRLPVDVDSLLRACDKDSRQTLALVVPPGVTWSLPIYEFALLARRRAEELGLRISICIYTPEAAPLGVFGVKASMAASELLRGRDIGLAARTRVRQDEDGTLIRGPGRTAIECSRAVALPAIEGPRVPGLPFDRDGFVPTDEYSRVRAVENAYAAGDGTTFPIKQGGVGCQQADVAATHIASKHGAPVRPEPFHPVLRGKLVTGADSLFLRSTATGGDGEGLASGDALWQPATKVAGRYLAPWLSHGLEPADLDLDEPRNTELTSHPDDWQGLPMALDPLGPTGID
jgi:sulfide:quinone oxidoreductase